MACLLPLLFWTVGSQAAQGAGEAPEAPTLELTVLAPGGEPFADRSVWVTHRHSGYEHFEFCGSARPALLTWNRQLLTDAAGRVLVELAEDWSERDEVSHLTVLDARSESADLGATAWISSVHAQSSHVIRLAPKRLIVSGTVEAEGADPGLFGLTLRELVNSDPARRNPVDGSDGSRRNLTLETARWPGSLGGPFEFWGWPSGEFIDLRFTHRNQSLFDPPFAHLEADVPVGSSGLEVLIPRRKLVQVEVEASAEGLPVNLAIVLRSQDPRRDVADERVFAVVRDGELSETLRIRPGNLQAQMVLLGSGRVLRTVELEQVDSDAPLAVVMRPPAFEHRLQLETSMGMGAYAYSRRIRIRGHAPDEALRDALAGGFLPLYGAWFATDGQALEITLAEGAWGDYSALTITAPTSGTHDLGELVQAALER